jgi:hypothetical protein
MCQNFQYLNSIALDLAEEDKDPVPNRPDLDAESDAMMTIRTDPDPQHLPFSYATGADQSKISMPGTKKNPLPFMNSALSDNTDAENHQTEDISHPSVHFLSNASVTKPEGLLLCTRDPATVWKKLLVYDHLYSRKGIRSDVHVFSVTY